MLMPGGTQKNGGVTSASWPERAAALAAVGLLSGLLLTGVGLGIANGGDGPMIPLYVFSSPFFFPLVIFAPITFWLFIGLLLASADERGYRAVFLVLMAMHYLGTAPYLLILGDWKRTYQFITLSPGVAAFALSLYLVGQVAVWGYYLERRPAVVEAVGS